MSADTLQSQTDSLPAPVKRHASESIDLVRARHPEARFRGPIFWPEDGLWIIEAFFDHGEDLELEAHLAERETDMLLEDDVWLCVVPLPHNT